MPEFGGNQILAGLAPAELAILSPHFEHVTLPAETLLVKAGQPAPFVYFPMAGVLALVGSTRDGPTVEVAVVGSEGIVSVSAILGPNRLPFSVLTQMDSEAWRIPTEIVSAQLHECGQLYERMLAYAQHLIVQIAQSAVCNRFHNARQRLARWLLMTADRTETRELPLTHAFISAMVGGPRSAVTEAAGALRQAGAIDYRRGSVHITDIDRLRAEACECYKIVRVATTNTSR